LILSFKR